MSYRALPLVFILSLAGCGSLSQQPEPAVTQCPAPFPVPGEEAKVCPEPVVCPPSIVERHRIGAVEYLSLMPEGLRLPARVDTGATTSSLGVIEQQSFERDGKPWVRFVVDTGQGPQEYMREVVRSTRIKGAAGTEQRLVVKMAVKLGVVQERIEMTLADRRGFEYPVLIGRNLLRGEFLVDVGQRYVLSAGAEGKAREQAQ